MTVVRALLLFLALALPVHAQKADEPATREEIDAALTDMRAAFATKDDEQIEAALIRQRLPDPSLIKLVAKGLKSKNPRVKQASLESLRWTPHKDALEVLHRTLRRDKVLRRDRELAPVLFKAIGQHGNPKSIELLVDDIFEREEDRGITNARLLALGWIRDNESIDELIELMVETKPVTLAPFMRAFRASLIQLTQKDHGLSVERWRDWWKDSERKFEIAERPPLMDRELQDWWDRFWGIDRPDRRGERREDRGKDA